MTSVSRVMLALGLCFWLTSAIPQDSRGLATLLAAPIGQENRVALVIGNANYKAGPLKNPANDAKDISAKLRTLGFQVVYRTDLTSRQIGSTLREFRSKLTPGGVALVFYAGHGVQIRGENYLPAVDAEIQTEEDVPNQSLSLRQLLDVLDESKTRLSLVFLDACRDNPFARSFRSAAGGLAKVDAPSGTLISYATRPGSVAADGSARNGLYTEHLLDAMDLTGEPIELALKSVIRGVKRDSNGRQEPWMEGAIEGDFYFRPAKVDPLPSSAPNGPSAQRSAIELENDAWLATRTADSVEGFDSYLRDYPSGRYRALAQEGSVRKRAQAALAEDEAAWVASESAGNSAALQAYLDEYPSGVHASDARTQLLTLRTVATRPISRETTIKVGLLHSLSGTMAEVETPLKDVALMAIDEINSHGGVLGRKLEPVVVDPASNWPLFNQKARDLLSEQKVAVIFGCATSVSRKSVLPQLQQLNGLLFYPFQSEGQELDNHVFYTGTTPNQTVIPAVEFLLSAKGGSARRFVLFGMDFVNSRTYNAIARSFLHTKGVADDEMLEIYVPFGTSDFSQVVAKIKTFASGQKTAVLSSLWVDSEAFYKELMRVGLGPTELPVLALGLGENELKSVDIAPFVGYLSGASYFESQNSPANAAFVAQFRRYAIDHRLLNAGTPFIVTDSAMEATYVGVHLWAQAVQKAGSTEVDRVKVAMASQGFLSPSGFIETMDPADHHLHKAFMVGEVLPNHQFKVIWQSADTIPSKWASQYSEYLGHP